MPLYEYECATCDKTVEVLVRTQTETAECPDCGQGKLTRIVSAPAAPASSGRQSLPVAGPGEGCGAPRCCGGGCDI